MSELSAVTNIAEYEARDNAGAIEGRIHPLIPTGTYAVYYVRHEFWFYLAKRPKMTVWFRILGPDDQAGIELPRYYNLKRIVMSDSKPTGGFAVGASSDFRREYVNLFGPPARLDRIPMSAFKGEWLNAEVVEVEKDSQGRPLHESLRYSVIKSLSILADEE